MKKNIFIIVFSVLFLNVLAAQNLVTPPSWQTIFSSRGNFSFQTLSTYIQRDTLSTLYYAAQLDTLGLQVHFIDNSTLISNDATFTALITQNAGDTLRAIAQFMINLTNGQLVSIQNLGTVGTMPTGLEFGILMPSELNANMYMFTRLFRRYNRFYAFTATSTQTDISRLTTYKTTFFNSINFY